ncbi:MAG: leucine-rich repeat domain-containing protein, partial [Dysgonamonadaceae bacterium]|jgi:hypothetical protein|nr:leucine-rich repeat domain-containing protein [Dysgonamonadaceae bacterium]
MAYAGNSDSIIRIIPETNHPNAGCWITKFVNGRSGNTVFAKTGATLTERPDTIKPGAGDNDTVQVKLCPEENKFLIWVTAEDPACTRVDTLVVKHFNEDAFLDSLTISGKAESGESGIMILRAEDFNPNKTVYAVTVGDTVCEITIRAVAGQNTFVADTLRTHQLANAGQYTFNILVATEKGLLRTYTVNLTKKPKSLDTLIVDGRTLSPVFHPDILHYEVAVGYDGEIEIKVEPMFDGVTFVKGYGHYTFLSWDTTFVITVSARNIKEELVVEREYTIRATRETWKFDKEKGVLTVGGKGWPYDNIPWQEDSTDIKSVMMIGDELTRIGEYAFFGYPGLTSVVIPESIKEIGGYAFAGCFGLTSVTNNSPYPQNIDETVFSNDIFDKCNLILPSGLEERYKGHEVWKRFLYPKNQEASAPTGILQPVSSTGSLTGRVYLHKQILHVDSPTAERIHIYSAAGTLLYSLDKQAGKASFTVHSAGSILIVRGSSGWVEKLIEK